MNIFPTPKISLVDASFLIVNKSYIDENQSLVIPYPCESPSSCSPYSVKFKRGSYIIDLYGGSGGNSGSKKGGKGGFVSAILTFYQNTEMFLYIGGRGHNEQENILKGGFNGGGDAVKNRGSGGGGTDIRGKFDDMYSRKLVAGGGGGALYNPSNGAASNGGDGGGLKGSRGRNMNNGVYPCYGGQSNCDGGSGSDRNQGTFGYGSSSEFGGGGGGWWGGGSANGWGSSGGSSYYGNLLKASTESGVNSGNGYAVIHTLIIGEYFTCTYRRKINFANNLFTFFLTQSI